MSKLYYKVEAGKGGRHRWYATDDAGRLAAEGPVHGYTSEAEAWTALQVFRNSVIADEMDDVANGYNDVEEPAWLAPVAWTCAALACAGVGAVLMYAILNWTGVC